MPSDAESSERTLRAIRENIILARQFVEGTGADRLHEDIRTLYAVIRCLEIISEASRRLSPSIKERHPNIPWNRIAGAGNVYRHDYESLSTQVIWNTVEALPPLLAVADQELASLRGEAGPE